MNIFLVKTLNGLWKEFKNKNGFEKNNLEGKN